MRWAILAAAAMLTAGCTELFSGARTGPVDVVVIEDTFRVTIHNGTTLHVRLGHHCAGGTFDEPNMRAKAFVEPEEFPAWLVVRDWKDPTSSGPSGWSTEGSTPDADPVRPGTLTYSLRGVAAPAPLATIEFGTGVIRVEGKELHAGDEAYVNATYDVSDLAANATVEEHVLVRYVGSATLRAEPRKAPCM